MDRGGLAETGGDVIGSPRDRDHGLLVGLRAAVGGAHQEMQVLDRVGHVDHHRRRRTNDGVVVVLRATGFEQFEGALPALVYPMSLYGEALSCSVASGLDG